MRHRKDHRKLSRTHSHRRAVLRNLVTALFQYERIETTDAKAKETRRVAERMITFAKRGDLAARRHVAKYVFPVVVSTDGRDVIQKLFDTIAPWYAERQGGYTRILKLRRRLGDSGEMVYLELVKSEEQKEKERQDRLAAAESREERAKGEKPAAKKAKAEAAKAEAIPDERPQRGGRKSGEAAPAKRRGKTGVKTG
jgi:large subunit ribosomal protein L17